MTDSGGEAPVSRRRVLVVRSGARLFSSLIPSSTVDVVERVTHVVEPILSGEEALERPANLAVFTSRIAVERLFSDPGRTEKFRAALDRGQIAAVGPATEQALRRHRSRVDVAAAGSGEDLLSRLPGDLAGWRVILPRGEDATAGLPEELSRRGAVVDSVMLYRKVPRPPDPDLDGEVRRRVFAAFCATSPSAAAWLFSGVGREGAGILRATPAVVLGPLTRRFLEARGVQRIETAPRSTFAAAARLLEILAGEEPAE